MIQYITSITSGNIKYNKCTHSLIGQFGITSKSLNVCFATPTSIYIGVQYTVQEVMLKMWGGFKRSSSLKVTKEVRK